RPCINTIILAGSVLKPNFPWSALQQSCVKRVINDCGTCDSILLLNQATVLFTGMAGRIGFAGMQNDDFVNRYFPYGHSDYFMPGDKPDDVFMRDYWLPLLCGDGAPAPGRVQPVPGMLEWALKYDEPIKLAATLTPFIVLSILFFTLYQQADAQRRAADSERRNAEAYSRVASRRAEDIHQRLVQSDASRAEQLMADGDYAASLPWLAEAIKLEADRPGAQRVQRIR